ncbi:MAG: MogA/MoaB family molybdenum cofactor biosynthesis protein [Acidimicrobiia bacterium]
MTEGPTERRAAVLTVSDSVAAGTTVDSSGPAASERLRDSGFAVVEMRTVPDGIESVAAALIAMADDVDLIVTTGGTGLSPRDQTPEGTLQVVDRMVPGLSEAMRHETYATVPFGKLSRGVCGLRGSCLIVNLPGSVKAVEEGLDVIADVLGHAVDIATGNFGDHR